MDKKKRYDLTLDPSVAEASRTRAHCHGMGLSTWVNYVLARTEGMAGDLDIPKAEDWQKEGGE
jgi:hypothetical protein